MEHLQEEYDHILHVIQERLKMRLHVLALLSVLTFAFLPMAAETGDAAAVIKYCGTPSSEDQAVSQVTNRMERDMTYGSLILHFQPAENGWTFLSGWYDHLPMTQKMVENRMPCFREAMVASAAEQPHGADSFIDPTIRAQTTAPIADTSTFGIPHLWMMIVLVIVVAVLFLLPGARRKERRGQNIEEMRDRRRPRLEP